MKLKILLFVLLFSGSILNIRADVPSTQGDTIKGLIISEAFVGNSFGAYFELTNMGNKTIDLSQIEIGMLAPWSRPPEDDFWGNPGNSMMLPDFQLEPGKSFVIASAYEYNPEQFKKGVPGFAEKFTRDQMWDVADYLVHIYENRGNQIDPNDSICPVPGAANLFHDIWEGTRAFFIRQHINETDSVVLDQVNGVFDGDLGYNSLNANDVAGFHEASLNCVLVRKYTVKTGNLDFANGRGVGEDDSEWIPIPRTESTFYRDLWWTVGNHGDYTLDENTLESDVADIDFNAKSITVPWGTRRADGIMELMKQKPGVAWIYHVSPVAEDSTSMLAHTGDKLEIIVAGSVGVRQYFDVIVSEPTADVNIVAPVIGKDHDGWWRRSNEEGILSWPRVSQNESGVDTIYGARGGLPYATRVDSLLSHLEKAPNATWEIEWVDGAEKRADLKNGDILKVTAKNGSVKEYFISVVGYRANTDAALSAITWPDIPEFYYDIFGWTGDTIPGFSAGVYNYRIQVPLDVETIPALVAKKRNANAKVEVKRASNLFGTAEDRTMSFTVTAEDDTTQSTYSVELVKEKDPKDMQPYSAEPFISQWIEYEGWGNCYVEICNPGNQPLDLSDYMFANFWKTPNPADLIRGYSRPEDWSNRYLKYIPGYKWVDEETWQVEPGTVTQDLNVNPMVMGGDVFVMGGFESVGEIKPQSNADFWKSIILPELDVKFGGASNDYLKVENTWNEPMGMYLTNMWGHGNFYIFKILNDSIKQGLKPANDPNDFELIESFGSADGSDIYIAGEQLSYNTNFIRKPSIHKGNKEHEGSFGTNADDSEWIATNRNDYSEYGYPGQMIMMCSDLGKHFMDPVTSYMSTVTSAVYKVSSGYSMHETIKGPKTGTTVADLLSLLFKANEKQTLTVKATADGNELTGDDVLSLNDTLVVLSADSTNTTKYILEVTDEGLSSDALLVSSKYTIEVQSQPKSANESAEAGAGTIAGFEYGTSLQTILNNITVPAGATLQMIDGNGAYVPLKMMNFDTTYVNVTVNDNIYFEVTAENSTTKIVYQLAPEVSEKDAFITSYVYSVDQKNVLINYVPRSTNTKSFLSNLVASAGASLKLIDKFGLERVDGSIAVDDKVVVTSQNGEVSRIYFISMLAEKYIPETTYLAYILSTKYDVNQVDYIVNGVDGATTIADFYSKITPSMGATAIVVDKDGNEKTSGDINGGDMVKVTSVDGKIVVMYSFGPLTAAGIVETNNIALYPNPTDGKLNISGVERGNRIQIFNANGSTIRDIIAGNSIEVVSLQKEPAGMYLIVISDNSKLLGRFKAIKR